MGRANVPHDISDDSALGGQSIGGSLRFRSASNTELSRTPSSAGNRKTFTWSGWVKRGDLSSTQGRLFGGGNTSNYFSIYFPSDDPLRVIWYEGGQVFTNTTAKFRDSSAWYHVVVAVDTTQSTAGDRIKIYVNGVLQEKNNSNAPSQNSDTSVNNTVEHNIGKWVSTSQTYFDGYLTEINFIDGQALDPSYFGYTESQTGIWRPKKFKAPSVNNHFNWALNNNITDALNGAAFTENGGSSSFVSAGSNSFGLTNCLDISGGKYLSYAITPASQWTIDFYVKLDNFTGANSYIGGWNGTNGSDCCVGVNKDNAPNYYFVVWGGSGNLYQTSVTVSLNTWYHIRMSSNATNNLRLYVNGTLVATDTSSNQNPDSPLTFGDMQSGRFDGQIAGVRYITRDLGAPPSGGLVSTNGVLSNIDSIIKYGANGFNLPMNGSSHVGKDMSGNGNNFTPNDCGTVPIDKATGAFPMMNTNNGATVPLPGFRPDPFASYLVLASTFSDPSDVLDVEDEIRGSGSSKGLFVTGTTKDTSQHNFYGRSGSLYFDGSSDYINLNATSDFNFGTGDFTIEFWMYSGVNSVDTYYRRLWMTDGPTENASGNFQIAIVPTTGVINLWETASALDVSGVSDVTTSTWNHIAAVRSGSTLKLYVNGKEELSTTYTTAISPNSGSPRPRIGNYNATSGQGNYNGYLQDYRVYKGVAKYTEEFLCGAVDSSIVQDSPSGIAIPRTLDSHTGGSVALHTTANVSPDIIVASNSDLYLDGDFTIEFWIYLNSINNDTQHPSVITFPDNSGLGQVYINSTNKFYSLWFPNTDICRTPYKSAKVGRWQYVTITRSSNSCRIFIDGVLQNTTTSSQAFGNSYGGLRIGGYTQNTGNIDGHISNLRIIKGTALYTSSFTPPTEPLTNVTGTSLLCFQSPNDVEAFTVDKNASTLNDKNWTRSGSFAWSIGADSSVTSKHRQFDGTIETGSAGAPNGNPGNVRFTFDTPITGITKCRIRANTHNDTYQYRRTYYNGANGTYSIQTSSNTTTWHDVSSNVGNTLNWVEWGSYGGADSDRGPYGCNGIEINDVLLTDRFRDDDGHGSKSSASHFSPFDNDIIQEGPSQYATLNPLAMHTVTLSNGNLTNTGGNDIPSNMGVKTGKFYVEVSIDTANSGSNLKHLGICATGRRAFRSVNNSNHILDNLDTVTIRSDANGPYTSTGRGGITSWTQVFNDTNIGFTIGDTVGIQLDMDNKFVKFYINGSLRVHYTFVLASTFDKMHFYGRNNGSGKTSWNFGQKPYEFTPPSGFLPLASHNLESTSILKPQKHFEPVLWTGNGGTSQTVTGLKFKPDFVWIKGTNTAWHRLQNSVTGANKLMYTNSQNAEAINEPNGYVSSFTNDGFILADPDGNGGGVNTNGDVYVAWCWKGGSPETPTNGSVHFDGNGDYLSLSSTSDFDFGTGDFTIECYFRSDLFTSSYYPYLFDFRTTGGAEAGSPAIYIDGAQGKITFWVAGADRVLSNGAPILGKWTHLAMVRSSGTTKMYVDGVAQSSTYSDTTDYGDGGSKLLIGIRRDAGNVVNSQSFNGEISNVRIVKGTAVYTSNFTPSSTPLTNVTNTKLLCCQSSTSATTAAITPGTISTGGNSSVSSSNPFDTFSVDGVGYATVSAAGLDGGTANPTGASVNTKAGFSIISYNATQNQNVSYSHGLNQAPEIIITKDRDNSRHWGVYYSVDGTNTNWMQLNLSNAQGSNNSGVTPVGGFSGSYMTLHQDYFAPAYNAFANAGNDGNDRIISYMWHSVPGYSKIGMYRGNGNDNGPFIDCGFRPAFIMTKSTSSSSYWWEMVDNKRSPINPSQRTLYANKNDAEYNSSSYNKDIFSNGFKPRSGNGGHNDNAETYLFMAFAEQPEVTPFGSQSNAR